MLMPHGQKFLRQLKDCTKHSPSHQGVGTRGRFWVFILTVEAAYFRCGGVVSLFSHSIIYKGLLSMNLT